MRVRMTWVSAALLIMMGSGVLVAVTSSGSGRVSPVRSIPAAAANQTAATYNYSADGQDPDNNLDAYYNADAPASSMPWVMTIHGGSWANADRTAPQMAHARDAFWSAGFAVFNIDYRQVTDYNGNPGVPFADQLDDVNTALDWIRAHADQFGIDPNRGVVYGFSTGGHLAAMVGLQGQGSSRVKAIVTVSGVLQPQRVADDVLGRHPGELVTDVTRQLYAWESVAMRCPYTTVMQECGQRWQAFLPENLISAGDPRMLMFQGQADQAIAWQMATAFQYHLNKAKVPNQLVLEKNVAHTDNLWYGNAAETKVMIDFVRSATSAGS